MVSNFKAEIELTEQELKMSKEIEMKLTELVHQVYAKLEMSYGAKDPEMKQVNRQLREILSVREFGKSI